MCDKQDKLYQYIVNTLVSESQVDYRGEEVWLPSLINSDTDIEPLVNKRGVRFKDIYGRFSLSRPPGYLFDYCKPYGLSKSETWVIWYNFSEQMKPIIRRYYPIILLKEFWKTIKRYYGKIRDFHFKIFEKILRRMMSKAEQYDD